jgi:hypothetical protein
MAKVLCREIYSKSTANLVHHAFLLIKHYGQRFMCSPHHNKRIASCELSCLPLPLLTRPYPRRRRLPTAPPTPDPAPHPHRQISSHTTQSLCLSHGHLTDRSGRSASNQRGPIPLCRLGRKGRGGHASVLEYEGRVT